MKSAVNTPVDLKNLPRDPEILTTLVVQLFGELRDKSRQIEQLTHTLNLLRRMQFGPRSEKLSTDQLLLSFAAMLTPKPPEPAPTPAPAAEAPKNGHGRRRLPSHLPRERVVHDVGSDEKKCRGCGTLLQEIGREASEQLDYHPASLHVIQHERIKYACQGCHQTVLVADLPPQPIEKGMPGPGLLAHVLVSKYADHLPLNRQEGIFKRQGVDLPKATLCDWVKESAQILKPVIDAVKKYVLEAPKIHTDDTPVPVLDETRKHTREGRLWNYVRDGTHPAVLYDYSEDHRKEWPLAFLKNYKGHLQADAYPGYNDLYRTGQVIEVGCWAHTRRYFFDAKDTDGARAQVALAYIAELYKVEEAAKELDPEARKTMRQERSKPVTEALKKWLNDEGVFVLPKSPMGEAFHYAQAQWTALTRYLENGMLDIDNSIAERTLRGVAVGRKNWMFAGSDEGGRRAAVIYTLIETCKLNKIDPFAYLRDVMARIATHPMSQIQSLTPMHWKPPPEKPDSS